MPSPTLNPRGEAAFSGACLAVNSPQALRLLLHIADKVALSVSGLKFANKRTWLTAAKLESPPRLQRGFDWTASKFGFAEFGLNVRMKPWLFVRGSPDTLPWAAKEFERAA